MPRFEQTGYVTNEIAAPSQAEVARQEAYDAFAFGGDPLGGGPGLDEILALIRNQSISPAQRSRIHNATFGGIARGYAPQLDAAANQLGARLNAGGIRGSTGSLYAGLAAPIAQELSSAGRQAAALELQLPFQQASALSGIRGQQAGFAEFSLQKTLSERSANSTQRQYGRKRGFFSKLGAALGGTILGGLTGGVGTAVAGGIAGRLGGEDARASVLGTNQPTINLGLGGYSSSGPAFQPYNPQANRSLDYGSFLPAEPRPLSY